MKQNKYEVCTKMSKITEYFFQKINPILQLQYCPALKSALTLGTCIKFVSKGQLISIFWYPRILPKNERTNSFLVLLGKKNRTR